jgi:hypothetical protein
MPVGRVLYVIAAVILFIGGIGSPLIPNPVIWGLFCLALGLVFDQYVTRRFW